jgi:hypothetical protein
MVSRINIDMIYEFYNKQTDQVEEHTMRLAEYDDFKANNPHLERYFGTNSMPGLGDGMRMDTPGIGKADSTFEKYVIQRMKDTIPGNTMSGHKTKMQREW